MKLLTVEAAQRRILKLVHPVATEIVPVERALGRVLASDIKSIVLPPFDNSSVDGFAVRSADVRTASKTRPVQLRVVDDIAAGSSPAVSLRPGQAARIMTGAEMPGGADAVVMLESTDHASVARGVPSLTTVRILESVGAGQHVRYRGSDAVAGRIVVRAGTLLRPQELGMLSMLGVPKIRVRRRPVIGILSSGNELLSPSRALKRGAIRETNSITLAGLAVAAGCQVLRLGIARDTRKSIEAHLRPATMRPVDMIVTSAGVSVGALDLVKDVVRAHGRLLFWRVNVRPGKPLAVGEYEGIPLIGLPGNPVSAFIGFELFVRPAIGRLHGQKSSPHRIIRARLKEPVTSDGRMSYLRAVTEEEGGSLNIRLTGHQGSGNLLSLVQANALLVIPAGVKSLAAGDQVEAWLL